MATKVYIDALKGNDSTGNGSASNPYKTLDYFCNSVASKNSADYIVYLQEGTYEILTGTIFGQFTSGEMKIIGLGNDTEILQQVGMYTNISGGYDSFTLTIAKCRYNISKSLTSPNLNGIIWRWNFYNVLFEYVPDNTYSIFSVLSPMEIRNCVKLTNTTGFLRKNSSTISVYDSMGYFTSGYNTSQTDWDKSGNTLNTVDGYEKILKKGMYKWIKSKTLILNDGHYKKYNPKTPPTKGEEYPKAPLTSYNSDPTFVVSASSEWGAGYYAYCAFTKTNTGSYDRYPTASGQLSGWLKVQLSNPLAFASYTVEANNRSGEVASTIKDWTLEGSNDNQLWHVLDTQSQTGWTSGEARNFIINSPQLFSFYRINFTSNNGYSSNTQIGELRFYTKGKDEVPASWETVTSTYPTLSQLKEHGMDDLLNFNRQVVELDPVPMIDKSTILADGEEGKVFSRNIDLKKYFDIRTINVEVKK